MQVTVVPAAFRRRSQNEARIFEGLHGPLLTGPRPVVLWRLFSSKFTSISVVGSVLQQRTTNLYPFIRSTGSGVRERSS